MDERQRERFWNRFWEPSPEWAESLTRTMETMGTGNEEMSGEDVSGERAEGVTLY